MRGRAGARAGVQAGVQAEVRAEAQAEVRARAEVRVQERERVWVSADRYHAESVHYEDVREASEHAPRDQDSQIR